MTRLFRVLVLFAVTTCLLCRESAVARELETEPGRVFEIRTYTTPDGKLGELQRRFREHTLEIFARHGMSSIAYFVPQDPPIAGHTLIYIIAHASRAQAEKNWQAFRDDPEWQRVRAASEANGPIVTKVESVFVEAADYSPLK